MTFTLTTSGACLIKAGAGANPAVSGSYLDTFSDQVEAKICALTRKDWVTDYATIKTNFKNILSDVASDLIAIKIINYDMSGYTSRAEAQTMMDVLKDNADENLKALKEDKIKEVM